MPMEWSDLLLRVNSAGHGRFWSGEVGFGMWLRIRPGSRMAESGLNFNCNDNCWRLLRRIINANGCGE